MYLYCIQCGHMDEVYQGSHRVTVIHQDSHGGWLEWKECSGPFVDVPMPASEPINVDNMIEPDVNELAIMNENASLLLADMMQ